MFRPRWRFKALGEGGGEDGQHGKSMLFNQAAALISFVGGSVAAASCNNKNNNGKLRSNVCSSVIP
jgi:hypothetical protein